MTAILVDSSVLLDVTSEDSAWFDWSSKALADAFNRSRLVINPIVFAEVSVRYSDIGELDALLSRQSLEREPLPYEAAFLAGKAFVRYRRRGGVRSAPLPDFFIGAHAAVCGYALLTRDARDYKRDFPTVELISP